MVSGLTFFVSSSSKKVLRISGSLTAFLIAAGVDKRYGRSIALIFGEIDEKMPVVGAIR